MTWLGVVLAGGSSSRMGVAKPSLEVGEETLLERAVERLLRVTDEVVIADRGQGLAARSNVLSELRSVDDGPGKGPVAGLLGAARRRPESDLLVLACDLPEAPLGLLHALRKTSVDRPHWAWVMPRWYGGTEPLVAVYRRAALELLAERVARGRYSLYGLTRADPPTGGFLEGETLRRLGDEETMFTNLNTPEDLERYRSSRSPGG